MTDGCDRLWEVDALREGRLSAAEAAAHRRHAAGCRTCRERFAADEHLATLGRALASPADDPFRVRRLRASILRQAASPARPRRLPLFAAAAFVALGLTAWAAFSPRRVALGERPPAVTSGPAASLGGSAGLTPPPAVSLAPSDAPAVASRPTGQPSARAAARPVLPSSHRDTSEYERAVAAYESHDYGDAARRCAAFVAAHPDAPEVEDAAFLEASALAHDGRTAAAADAAERFLARFGAGSFHARDAAILVARGARNRGDCRRARDVLARWSSSPPSPEIASALGPCLPN